MGYNCINWESILHIIRILYQSDRGIPLRSTSIPAQMCVMHMYDIAVFHAQTIARMSSYSLLIQLLLAKDVALCVLPL
jgi:hypothetical protein